MLKMLTIVAIAATASVAIPAATFAQMENGMGGGDSMSKGSSMGGMKSKSSMMKKKKMHSGMRHGMMRKPMSGAGAM